MNGGAAKPFAMSLIFPEFTPKCRVTLLFQKSLYNQFLNGRAFCAMASLFGH